jgi:biopolymer transport protein ExbB
MINYTKLITQLTEKLHNLIPVAAADPSTFFSQFIIAGGPIVWFILIPVSVITTYLAILLALTVTQKKLLPDHQQEKSLTSLKNINQLSEKISKNKNLVTDSLKYALDHAEKKSPRQLRELTAQALTIKTLHIKRKIQWCSIIASVSPMVGLFGTVYGMIKAFNILGISAGQPRPDQLASAISIALITTFWGLLVAIPALAMYGFFSAKLDNITAQAAMMSDSVISNLNGQKNTLPLHEKEKQTEKSEKIKSA